MSKYTLEAQYTAYSQWDIDFDISTVADWYIKYDTLFVQHNKDDDDWEKYHPSASGECDYKTPDVVMEGIKDGDGYLDNWTEVG